MKSSSNSDVICTSNGLPNPFICKVASVLVSALSLITRDSHAQSVLSCSCLFVLQLALVLWT